MNLPFEILHPFFPLMKPSLAFPTPLVLRAKFLVPTLLRPLASVAALLLTALGGLAISGQARAQEDLATVTPLYSFSTPSNSSKLVEDNAGNFYGTQAPDGGLNQVYRLSPTGIFTSLYLFEGTAGTGPESLIMGTDGNLYGVATTGGTVNGGTGAGTVYRLTVAGEFALLHTFDGTNDGSGPNNLIQGTDGNFYGTTAQGGANNAGTVFRITPAGGFTTLYSFAGGTSSRTPLGLVQGSDGNLYGTTTYGGAAATANNSGYGTVFRLTPAGAFTLLHSFTNGSDDASPSLLIQGSDGNFYGEAASAMGIGAGGVIVTTSSFLAFKITPSGDFTRLALLGSGFDGGSSVALTQGSDGNFYGLSEINGDAGRGSIVQITPAGQVTTLYTFTASGTLGTGGYSPLLLGNDGSFYGTTNATLYRLTLLPESALVPVITTSSLPASEQGVAYTYQVAATPAAEVFTATGLPDGLTISSSGVIAGTPTESGTFQVVVSAENQAGTGTATLTLVLAGLSPVITSAPAATVEAGQPFTYQITSDTPGASFGASNLPLGLHVTAAGLISGAVTTPGTYDVTLQAANKLSNYGTAPFTLTVTTLPPTVNLMATVPLVTAGSGEEGAFVVSRTGDASQELIVAYTITGTGVNGTDYRSLPGTRRFKAGKTSVTIHVIPAGTPSAVKRTVKLTLSPNANYQVGGLSTAKVKIEPSE